MTMLRKMAEVFGLCGGRSDSTPEESEPVMTEAELEAYLTETYRGRRWLQRDGFLELQGFPIRIRRLPPTEINERFGARFAIEVDGLPLQYRVNLGDAKECGEQQAREIDALPLAPSVTCPKS